MKRKLEAWLEVLAWNESNPVGSYVAYDSYIRRLGVCVCRTRSAARVLPGDVAGVWITGHPVAVRLDKLQLLDTAAAAAAADRGLLACRLFWILPSINPLVPVNVLAVELVYSGVLNSQAPAFTVLADYVLKRNRNLAPIGEAEGIDQLPDLLR